MMDKRQPGRSLFLVVDEVSQYVHDDEDRMLALQSFVAALGQAASIATKPTHTMPMTASGVPHAPSLKGASVVGHPASRLLIKEARTRKYGIRIMNVIAAIRTGIC